MNNKHEQIETILLDLDGPLLDGKVRHYHCYADILTALGYSPMVMNTYWEMKRNRQSRREILALSGAWDIYDTFLTEWIQKIEQLYYLVLDQIQTGAIAQLKKWNKSGLDVHLVTMRRKKENLLDQLHVTGLKQYLSSVIVCDHAKGGTGKAEAVNGALPGIRVASSLWIGDTEADLDAARYFGCPVWLLSCGLRTKEHLLRLQPDFLSDSIANVNVKIVV